MSRRNFEVDGYTYVVGWDGPLNTFFLQAPTKEDVVCILGALLEEYENIASFEKALGELYPSISLTNEMRELLIEDRVAEGNLFVQKTESMQRMLKTLNQAILESGAAERDRVENIRLWRKFVIDNYLDGELDVRSD